MDRIHYQYLKHYLETAQTPNNFSPIQKTKLVSKSNYYIIVKDQLYKNGAAYASMSGSGSSVYGLFEKTSTPDIHWPASYFTRWVT